MSPRKRAAPPPPEPGTWSHVVGIRPHRVTAYERVEKGNVLYLKWRANGNWQKESLGKKLRDADGQILADVEQEAVARATARYNALVAGLPRGAKPKAEAPPLTLGETERVITDPDTGLYSVDGDYRREVLRELRRAVLLWGPATPWTLVDVDSYTALGRRRVRQLRAAGHTGMRGAEVTVTRVATIAAWLRDTKKIPATAGHASRRWKADLKRYWSDLAGGGDPPVSRPRHTLAECRAILKAALEGDEPRFTLLYVLGAELRLGQVKRCQRSHLHLGAPTLAVPGRRHKKGTTVELTAGQVWAAEQALAGYLAECEAAYQADGTDYLLFPGGPLRGLRRQRQGKTATVRVGVGARTTRPVSRKWIADRFREAEAAARVDGKPVAHVPGRGPYGARRQAVDTANDLKVSAKGLQSLGGWTDVTTPQRIYAEQENLAGRAEARAIREQIRGGVDAPPTTAKGASTAATTPADVHEQSPNPRGELDPSRTPDVPQRTTSGDPEGTPDAGTER